MILDFQKIPLILNSKRTQIYMNFARFISNNYSFLYCIFQIKQIPRSLTISPNGRIFTIFASNYQIYIFNLQSGKIIEKLDESLQKYVEMGKETK